MGFLPVNLSRSTPTKRKGAVARRHRVVSFIAPNGGLNYFNSLADMPQNDATVLDNLIPRSSGCELRAGFKEHATLLPSDVLTLMPYTAPRGAVTSQLFAACADGKIYNISDGGDGPWTAAVTITGQTVPGEFSWVNMLTGVTTFLCCVSQGGGYWVYDSTNGWRQVTDGAGALQVLFTGGANLSMMSHIMVWKSRIIFIRASTGESYALPVNQIAGTATLFDFGPMFKHGGSLDMMASWSLDAGSTSGLMDKLVVVSSEGDVLVYDGDGIAAANFAINAKRYVGKVPTGKRYITQYGGDMGILSERGLTFMSELLRNSGDLSASAIALKINPTLSERLHASLDVPGWELRFVPDQKILLVNCPDLGASSDIQYAQDVNSQSWCRFTGMCMHTAEVFNSTLYFADDNNKVYACFAGSSDNQLLDGTPGRTLEGTVQSAFSPFGAEAFRLKIFHEIFSTFIASAPPSVSAKINPEWKFASVGGSPAFSGGITSKWNNAYWNQARWAGGTDTYKGWNGVNGMGYYGALMMRISGNPGTKFISWQALVEDGGIM